MRVLALRRRDQQQPAARVRLGAPAFRQIEQEGVLAGRRKAEFGGRRGAGRDAPIRQSSSKRRRIRKPAIRPWAAMIASFAGAVYFLLPAPRAPADHGRPPAVARMSGAKCGASLAANADPGFRCAPSGLRSLLTMRAERVRRVLGWVHSGKLHRSRGADRARVLGPVALAPEKARGTARQAAQPFLMCVHHVASARRLSACRLGVLLPGAGPRFPPRAQPRSPAVSELLAGGS